MGVAASAGAKAFAHSISFGITLAILTNLSQFVFHGAKRRKKKGASHWQVYGPFYLTAIAVPLVMADLTRHVLQDSGLWNGPSSHMYKPTARCQATDPPPSGCLSATGIIFTILFTYSGFTCLIIGSLWSADLHKKLAAAWKLARG